MHGIFSVAMNNLTVYQEHVSYMHAHDHKRYNSLQLSVAINTTKNNSKIMFFISLVKGEKVV